LLQPNHHTQRNRHSLFETTGFHNNRAYTYSFLPWQMIPRNYNPPPWAQRLEEQLPHCQSKFSWCSSPLWSLIQWLNDPTRRVPEAFVLGGKTLLLLDRLQGTRGNPNVLKDDGHCCCIDCRERGRSCCKRISPKFIVKSNQSKMNSFPTSTWALPLVKTVLSHF
jgi:hypothetical protein